MKKYISIIIFSILLIGCEKNVIGDFGGEAAIPVDLEDGSNQISEEAKLKKRGASFTSGSKDWSYKTSDLKAHWMYSWGRLPQEEMPANVEFVPMFWGKGSVNDENLANVKQYIDDGTVKYVLGFNEPDGATQANMSVDEAIALWPKLETLGVPLGSPATVDPLNGWMDEFMRRADELGLRVDFVAVHSYGGPNTLSLINKLKNTYNAYNRPIWITEFAVADWSATSPENNRHSDQQVQDFMTEILPTLDQIDYIHRYCWFPFSGNAPQGTSSALFDEESNLTPLGNIYANHNPNLEIGPGQNTDYVPPVDLGQLIINGGFESGSTDPWGGFKNRISGKTPKSGAFCGEVENGDGSLFTVAPVEAGKTYVLKFSSRWLETVANSFQPVLRNNDGNALLLRLDPVPLGDSWADTVFEYTVPDGVSELKIVFYKGQGFPPFFLDDVSLKEKQ
ncbi:glycosyl hydrolase [Gaetbulibacter sp. M240]|uniref:glycosyl hydrolase n=1 Tax=Gaetbulibacter sp. M240 TaxID=3126511 RepID=UPI00374F427D